YDKWRHGLSPFANGTRGKSRRRRPRAATLTFAGGRCPPALNAFRVGGFFLLRNKASAARPPALKPVPVPVPVPATPAAAPVQSGPATVESLGQELRQALPARRLHSVSLCDHEANVLWLSEGALGPDEHVLVVEALELLAADPSLNVHEMGT